MATALVAVAALVAALLARTAADEAGDRAVALATQVKTLDGTLRTRGGEIHATRSALEAIARRLTAAESTVAELPDATAVIAEVQPSVFTVETESGSGSAFVLFSEPGRSRLITNAHVVAEVYNLGGRGVRLVSGERTLSATITAISHRYDLALLEVAADLPALELAPARASAGDPVYVVGSPLGFEGTVANGIASTYRVEEGVEYLQFSAAINPGNSGGPVVDGEGRVLGVSTLKIVGFGIEGLSFAVPIERVCEAFDIC